jgi:hypothetical protein
LNGFDQSLLHRKEKVVAGAEVGVVILEEEEVVVVVVVAAVVEQQDQRRQLVVAPLHRQRLFQCLLA